MPLVGVFLLGLHKLAAHRGVELAECHVLLAVLDDGVGLPDVCQEGFIETSCHDVDLHHVVALHMCRTQRWLTRFLGRGPAEVRAPRWVESQLLLCPPPFSPDCGARSASHTAPSVLDFKGLLTCTSSHTFVCDDI